MIRLKKQRGLTMLEVMLVLVIGLFIIGLSIQQYLSYRRDADVRQLRNNVDMIFGAMETDFKANCTKGSFANSTSVSIPIPLSTLMNRGYLVLKGNVLPVNPLVDRLVSQNTQYILQFNQYVNAGVQDSRMQPMSPINGGAAPADKPVGKIMIWQAQVAVKMRDAATVQQYVHLLNATCSSDINGTTVTPCSQVPTGTVGSYVVFERSASSGGQVANSLNLSLPVVKQFRQMYTTEPILLLLSGGNLDKQYYLCGS